MRTHPQDLWSWVLHLQGAVCRLLMGWVGSFASFPIPFFWITARTLWISSYLQREPTELREFLYECPQGPLHALTYQMPTCQGLLFGSAWFSSKDYTLWYCLLVFTLTQQVRRAACAAFCGMQCICSVFLSQFSWLPFHFGVAGCGIKWCSETPQCLLWSLTKSNCKPVTFL